MLAMGALTSPMMSEAEMRKEGWGEYALPFASGSQGGKIMGPETEAEGNMGCAILQAHLNMTMSIYSATGGQNSKRDGDPSHLIFPLGAQSQARHRSLSSASWLSQVNALQHRTRA